MNRSTPTQWVPHIAPGPTLATEPSEPVTTAEAKNHLRYTNTDKDSMISMLITVARQQVEHLTQRSIMRASFTLKHCAWLEVDNNGSFSKTLRLPFGPVITISQVQYRRSSDGAYATLASDQYELAVSTSGQSHLMPAFNVTMPVLYAGKGPQWDAVKVDYIAGAAVGVDTAVDQRLRQAILMLVAYYFERPESTNWDVPADLASNVRALTHQLDLTPL